MKMMWAYQTQCFGMHGLRIIHTLPTIKFASWTSFNRLSAQDNVRHRACLKGCSNVQIIGWHRGGIILISDREQAFQLVF